MADQFIAICGQSAVGKATLIQRLLGADTLLLQRFGLADVTIAAFGAKFGRFMEQHTKAHTVLWKWQLLSNNCFQRLTRLTERYPNAGHRAIVIWLPPHVHYRQFKKKWPEEAKRKSPEDLRRCFVKVYVPRFRDDIPRLGIRVELVDGCTPTFAPMKEWPE